MNYSLLLLIFFIFIFPFSYLKKLYLIDAPSLKIPKIINLSICLLLIIDLATEDSNLRTLVTNFSEFKDYYFMDLGGINKWIMLIGKIILLFVNFYLIVVIYNLVRRNRQYRVIFIRVLIFYIPLKSLDLYKVAFDMSNVSIRSATYCKSKKKSQAGDIGLRIEIF